jgi:hypothetical protein
MAPKYPDITVPLTGEDGNAYAILGKVRQALRQAGLPAEEQEADRFCRNFPLQLFEV